MFFFQCYLFIQNTVPFRSIRLSCVTHQVVLDETVDVPHHMKSGQLPKTIVQKPIFFSSPVGLGVVLAALSGQYFWSVTGHPPTGQCQKFIHLVTGHTPGRIDQKL